MSRIPAPEGEQRCQRRKREEPESDVWMRQVQTIGTPDPGSLWVHVGDRGADRFPFCGSVSGDPDPLSGASGEVTAGAAGRRREHVFADGCTILAEPGQPTIRGSSPTWAPSPFDPGAACLWAHDALATAKRAASGQEPHDGRGHARLGRAGERCRGAAGMDFVDLGAHHDA